MKNTALKNFLRVEPRKSFQPQRRAGSRKVGTLAVWVVHLGFDNLPLA